MIYKRQKVLLKILSEKQTKVSKIQLLKLLFLLRQETDLSKMNGFYDFVPSEYGPFSFTVYRDIAEIKRLGLIDQDDKYIWCESKIMRKEYTQLPKSTLESISDTMNKF